jgi:hypothetical protein
MSDYSDLLTQLMFAKLAQKSNDRKFTGKFEAWFKDGELNNFKFTEDWGMGVGGSNIKVALEGITTT